MKKIFILLIVVVWFGLIIAGYLLISNWLKEPGEEKVCQDLCGDGICQQIVCLAIGCPCAETLENCAQDCIIQSFEQCIAAGYPVLESYPRQCKTPDGKSFTEYTGNELEKIDLIRIDYPRPNQEIESPLIIKGEARGYWFFEGDFPVVLTDWDGLIIAQAIAQAKGEWMTEDFVQFEAQLEFEKPQYNNKGTLILRKDNPSGLPENDDALEIPVIFK